MMAQSGPTWRSRGPMGRRARCVAQSGPMDLRVYIQGVILSQPIFRFLQSIGMAQSGRMAESIRPMAQSGPSVSQSGPMGGRARWCSRAQWTARTVSTIANHDLATISVYVGVCNMLHAPWRPRP